MRIFTTLLVLFLFTNLSYADQSVQDRLKAARKKEKQKEVLLEANPDQNTTPKPKSKLRVKPKVRTISKPKRKVRSYSKSTLERNKPKQTTQIQPKVYSMSDEGYANVSQKEYKQLLATKGISNPSEFSANFGFCAIGLKQDPDDVFERKNIRLDVNMVKMPNFLKNGKFLSKTSRFAVLTIENVLNSQGENVYDPAASFESEFFRDLEFSLSKKDPMLMQAKRKVSFKNNIHPEKISAIKGTLHLTFPLGINFVTFNLDEVGQTKTCSGKDVIFKKADDKKIQIEFFGDADDHVDVVAYDNLGNKVGLKGCSVQDSYGRSGLSLNNGHADYTFKGVPSKIKVFMASEMLRYDYPFRLKRKLKSTIEPQKVSSADIKEVEAVHQSFLNALKFQSKQKVRQYLSIRAQKEFDNYDEEKFNLMCQMMEQSLPKNFDDAEIVIKENKAYVQWNGSHSSNKDGVPMSSSWKLEAVFVKENGQWKIDLKL